MVPAAKRNLLALLSFVPSLVLVAMVAWLWTVAPADGSPWLERGDVRDALWAHRHAILVGIAVASLIGPLASLLVTSIHRRRSIQYFLDHMHARFWTTRSNLDPEYRISLFVPTVLGARLKCQYRTNGVSTRKTWSQERPADGRHADGVAGVVWLTGMSVHVGSPPDRPTDEELAEYRRLSHMTEHDQDKRSWSKAAVLGIPVQRPSDARPIGVLLVERNRPESKVGNATIRDFEHDVRVCAMLLEGQL